MSGKPKILKSNTMQRAVKLIKAAIQWESTDLAKAKDVYLRALTLLVEASKETKDKEEKAIVMRKFEEFEKRVSEIKQVLKRRENQDDLFPSVPSTAPAKGVPQPEPTPQPRQQLSRAPSLPLVSPSPDVPPATNPAASAPPSSPPPSFDSANSPLELTAQASDDPLPSDVVAIKRRPRSAAGLANLGQTCYMNSVLQCLASAGPLVHHLLVAETHRRERRADVSSDFVDSFARTVKVLTTASEKDPVFPETLYAQVGRVSEEFMGNQQQDAMSCLQVMLSELHRATNRGGFDFDEPAQPSSSAAPSAPSAYAPAAPPPDPYASAPPQSSRPKSNRPAFLQGGYNPSAPPPASARAPSSRPPSNRPAFLQAGYNPSAPPTQPQAPVQPSSRPSNRPAFLSQAHRPLAGSKPPTPLQPMSGSSSAPPPRRAERKLKEPATKAERSWFNSKTIDDSFVTDMFDYQLKHTITCTRCQKVVSERYEVDRFLLPVPLSEKMFKHKAVNADWNSINIRECLRLFFSKGEDLPDYRCGECGQKKCCTQSTQIHRLPRILVLQIKRRGASGRTKARVEFPLRLNMSPFRSDAVDSKESPAYELFGVVNHNEVEASVKTERPKGVPASVPMPRKTKVVGGHYTAFAKAGKDGQDWYWFNDSKVKLIPASAVAKFVCTKSALVVGLFYEMMPTK